MIDIIEHQNKIIKDIFLKRIEQIPNMKSQLIFICYCMLTVVSYAQVGVGTSNPESTLDIRSSNQATPINTDGILIPKADEFPSVNPSSPQDGMQLFLTGNGMPSKGFYYWDDNLTLWVKIATNYTITNPKYPDGFTGIQSVNQSMTNASPPYVVPVGKNLYITQLYITAGFFFIDGNRIFYGPNNSNDYQAHRNPIIVGEGESITVDTNAFTNWNGFLIDAKVEPITIGNTYTVPLNKTLVVLTAYTYSYGLSVEGNLIYNGSSNFGPRDSFVNPIIVSENETISLVHANGVINGYLMDN